MQNEKLEMQNAADSGATPPLPKIVSLREFVEQMERQHGDTIYLQAIRAALDEAQPT
jgi:hypothetical protein